MAETGKGSRTVTPSEFVRPGNVVLVYWRDRYDGPTKYVRREVEKVNATTFTVHDVKTPGAQPRPVQFRNSVATGATALSRGEAPVHEASASNLDIRVMEDGTAAAEHIVARVSERAAVERVNRATRVWEQITRELRSPYPDKRPSAVALDEALVELAASAVALREVWGVPGGDDETAAGETGADTWEV